MVSTRHIAATELIKLAEWGVSVGALSPAEANRIIQESVTNQSAWTIEAVRYLIQIEHMNGQNIEAYESNDIESNEN